MTELIHYPRTSADPTHVHAVDIPHAGGICEYWVVPCIDHARHCVPALWRYKPQWDVTAGTTGLNLSDGWVWLCAEHMSVSVSPRMAAELIPHDEFRRIATSGCGCETCLREAEQLVVAAALTAEDHSPVEMETRRERRTVLKWHPGPND